MLVKVVMMATPSDLLKEISNLHKSLVMSGSENLLLASISVDKGLGRGMKTKTMKSNN